MNIQDYVTTVLIWFLSKKFISLVLLYIYYYPRNKRNVKNIFYTQYFRHSFVYIYDLPLVCFLPILPMTSESRFYGIIMLKIKYYNYPFLDTLLYIIPNIPYHVWQISPIRRFLKYYTIYIVLACRCLLKQLNVNALTPCRL